MRLGVGQGVFAAGASQGRARQRCKSWRALAGGGLLRLLVTRMTKPDENRVATVLFLPTIFCTQVERRTEQGRGGVRVKTYPRFGLDIRGGGCLGARHDGGWVCVFFVFGAGLRQKNIKIKI